MAVEAKAAVISAVKYLMEILELTEANKVTIEELTLSSDKKDWIVTLAFTPSGVPTDSLSVLLNGKPRESRKVTVSAADGKALSIQK